MYAIRSYYEKYMLEKVLGITEKEFAFDSFEEVNIFFKRVINQLKQMNYAEWESDKFRTHEKA